MYGRRLTYGVRRRPVPTGRWQQLIFTCHRESIMSSLLDYDDTTFTLISSSQTFRGKWHSSNSIKRPNDQWCFARGKAKVASSFIGSARPMCVLFLLVLVYVIVSFVSIQIRLYICLIVLISQWEYCLILPCVAAQRRSDMLSITTVDLVTYITTVLWI